MNQVESESLRETFIELGHTAAESPEAADLVVVNTCSVTAKADRDCVAFLRKTAAANPKAAIAVTGCLATLEPQKILAAAPGATLFTNKDKENIPAQLCGTAPSGDFFSVTKFHGKARAFIEAEALAWGVGTADAAEIDRDNILRATMRAMRRALDDMHVRLREKAEAAEGGGATTSAPAGRHPRTVDAVLIDGERFEGYLSPEPPHEFLPYSCVIDGDARFLSVAAASVLAKTHHDEHVIRDMHPRFPAYGWDRNKCYGSADHIATLRRIGACEEHRTKFVSKFVTTFSNS